MKKTARIALYVIALLFIVATAATLAGCGGGDNQEDEKAGTMPVDCKTEPQRCK